LPLAVSGFEDVEGTVTFISMMDQLVNMNNSRSPAATGYKAPLCF